jgi:DNA-binding transcriptional LysR family regulator
MNVDLRHFEAFLAVVRFGTFTRAAAALHVSQPALTVQIRQLEQELGVRLFDRNNRRVLLTGPGREFVAPLERLLADTEAIVRHASDIADRRRGVVTVAALPSVAAELLPRAIRQVTRNHEGIVVRVRDVVAGRILELLRASEVDLGIGTLERPDPDVAFEPLFADRLSAFVPYDHRFRTRTRLTLADFRGQPLILTSRDSSVRIIVDRALHKRQVPVHVTQEPTYVSTALGLVRAGVGIAILPDSAASGAAPGEIAVVPIRDPLLIRHVGLLTNGGRSLSPVAEILVGVVRSSTQLTRSRRGGRGRTR